MKELVVATNNEHKLKEIRNILKDYKILSLKDINFYNSIVEDENTFEGDSLKKATIVAKYCNKNTIADDSGLCISLLNGEPGVFSARYSNEGTDDANIKKVLKKLNGKESSAKFISAITIVFTNGNHETFIGECKGKIILEKKGKYGFGYDPIFFVEKYKKTFAEMKNIKKNEISHRRKALDKLKQYLENNL